MVNKLNKKIVTLLISFLISIILSAVISTCLHLIFTKNPEGILSLNISKVVNSIINNSQNREMFYVIVLAFMTLACTSIFRVFKLNNYHAKTYKVTPEIEIPVPVGKSQTQHGSAWWLDKKKYKENFGVNIIDPDNPTISALLDENNTNKVEPIFKKGRSNCWKSRKK